MLNTEEIIESLPILTAVFGSSVIAALISGFVSVITARRSSRLEHITRDRSKWREEIRNIGDLLYSNDLDNINRALSKLKLYINAYGMNTKGSLETLRDDEYLRDAHIWRMIYILENEVKLCRLKFNDGFNDAIKDISTEINRIDLEIKIDLLIKYLSLLLKFDWERAKMEVEVNKRRSLGLGMMVFGYFTFMLSIDLPHIFSPYNIFVATMYTIISFFYYLMWRKLYIGKLRRDILGGRRERKKRKVNPLFKSDFVSKHYFEINLMIRDLGIFLFFVFLLVNFIGLRFGTFDFSNQYMIMVLFLSIAVIVLGVVLKDTEEGGDLRRDILYVASIKETTINQDCVNNNGKQKNQYIERLLIAKEWEESHI